MHSPSRTGSTNRGRRIPLGGLRDAAGVLRRSMRAKEALAKGENAGFAASGSRLRVGPPECVAPATDRRRRLEDSERTMRGLRFKTGSEIVPRAT